MKFWLPIKNVCSEPAQVQYTHDTFSHWVYDGMKCTAYILRALHLKARFENHNVITCCTNLKLKTNRMQLMV